MGTSLVLMCHHHRAETIIGLDFYPGYCGGHARAWVQAKLGKSRLIRGDDQHGVIVLPDLTPTVGGKGYNVFWYLRWFWSDVQIFFGWMVLRGFF